MADLTGKTLGKYRLVERLGRGGMAEVYKGYQPNLDRYVAVKLMHAYLAEDEDFVGRFKREARAIASLRHPHIVQVYDFDIEQDVYYMVQEFIDGGTLKMRLQQASARGETIPLEETVRLFTALCSAVDYAHGQGRIHRDIKPDNIMFDADDRPVLTDFGIASIVGGTRFTATGAMIGTPAYMSPEQGKGDPNDYRSDIYSLGVVLYEMVTGRVPFDADTPFAVVLKHLNEALPMPSAINPGLKPGVERVILKAMAKDPEDRYQSACAMSADLEEAVREPDVWEMEPLAAPAAVPETEAPVAPVATAPKALETEAPIAPVATAPKALETDVVAPPQRVDQAEPVEKAKPAGKRRTWIWIGAAVLGVVLIGCCLLALAANANRNKNKDLKAQATATLTAVGESQATAALAAASEAGQLVQMGYETLGTECGGDVDGARRLFERALEGDKDSTLALVGLAQCAMCSGDSENALKHLDAAIAIDPEDALAYLVRGQVWAYEEEGDKAMADLDRAVELAPDNAEAYFWRGMAANYPVEDYEQAYADMSKVIELAPDFAQAYLVRGQINIWYRSDADAALADLTRYVELAPEDPNGYAARGEVYLDAIQDYEKAIAEYTRAIELDDTDGYTYSQRAWANMNLENWETAIEDLSRAIDLDPTGHLYVTRGMAKMKAGQHEDALADLDRALLIGDIHPGAAHHGKGWVYAAMGRYADAIDAYTKASEDNWEDYAWPFFEDSHWLLDRGTAYRELGRFDEALADHDALIALWESWFRPYYERGLTRLAMGHQEEALADFQQAFEYVDDPVWRERILEQMGATQ